MNGDLPNLSNPLDLKFDTENDGYFNKIVGNSSGFSTNSSNPSFFPSRGPDNGVGMKSLGGLHQNLVGNMFPTSNIHMNDTENGHWGNSLSDGRKSNGSSNVFDAFSPLKNEQQTLSMDFNLPSTGKNNSFGDNFMLQKGLGYDAPPGFSQSKKSPWAATSSQSSSIKNGFPSVSPLSSENILNSSGNDDPGRPGSTSSTRLTSSSNNFSMNNWPSNISSYGYMDFNSMNGFLNKNTQFITDVNSIFMEHIKVCYHVFFTNIF